MEPTSNFLMKHCEHSGFLGFFFLYIAYVQTYQKQSLTDKEAIFLTAATHFPAFRLGACEVGVDVM